MPRSGATSSTGLAARPSGPCVGRAGHRRDARGHARTTRSARSPLDAGARPLRQRGHGPQRRARQARDEAVAGGASAVLILPIDLPLVSPDGHRRRSLAASTTAGPARSSPSSPTDTAAARTRCCSRPPDVIDFAFGGDSRDAHVAAAARRRRAVVELDGPLRVDLDTPDDLLLPEAEPSVEAVRG